MNTKDLLISAIQNNQVIEYFKGTNGYRIQGINGDQNNIRIQDYSKVVWSFQEFHRENPNYNIPKILYENIMKLLESSETFDIYTALNILDSQLTAEYSKFCVFKLDNLENLLLKLKEILIKNKEKLNKTIVDGESISVWELANNYNEFNVSRGRKSFL